MPDEAILVPPWPLVLLVLLLLMPYSEITYTVEVHTSKEKLSSSHTTTPSDFSWQEAFFLLFQSPRVARTNGTVFLFR